MTLTELRQVVAAIDHATRERARTMVGIVGPPGAGKTHLARELAAELRSHRDVALVAMDGFHRPNEELARLGRSHRKGAPDTFDADAFVGLVGELAVGDTTVGAPAFSRELDEPIADAVTIGPHVPIVLVEGNYLLLDEQPWSQLRTHLHLVLYVDALTAVRRTRLLDRQRRRFGDAAAAERWVGDVDEPNARLVESTRHRADQVVAVDELPGLTLW